MRWVGFGHSATGATFSGITLGADSEVRSAAGDECSPLAADRFPINSGTVPAISGPFSVVCTVLIAMIGRASRCDSSLPANAGNRPADPIQRPLYRIDTRRGNGIFPMLVDGLPMNPGFLPVNIDVIKNDGVTSPVSTVGVPMNAGSFCLRASRLPMSRVNVLMDSTDTPAASITMPVAIGEIRMAARGFISWGDSFLKSIAGLGSIVIALPIDANLLRMQALCSDLQHESETVDSGYCPVLSGDYPMRWNFC